MKTCHIFAGGEISGPEFIKTEPGDMVICADRGIVHAERLGIKPDIIVGDFDSYSGEIPESGEIYRSVPEKDDTDTMLALKIAIEKHTDKVMIYGALGGRFDHTAANIQTLKYASDHGCEAVIADTDNIISLQTAGRCEYKLYEGWYFSVFAYSERVFIKEMSGVKYPLRNVEITNSFPLGVSNEIISGKAVLDLQSGTALVVRSKM